MIFEETVAFFPLHPFFRENGPKNRPAVISSAPGTTGEQGNGRESRDLLVMRSGGSFFGVFADETESVSEKLVPVPLPHAPRPILGLVHLRGRMRTVIDPLLLAASGEAEGEGKPPRFIVSLRGDTQLALGVERVERITEIFMDEVEEGNHTMPAARGTVCGQAGEKILLLDIDELFQACLSGSTD